jgi:hypothetical protein
VTAPAERHVVGARWQGSPHRHARDRTHGPVQTDIGLAASTGATGLAPPLRRLDAVREPEHSRVVRPNQSGDRLRARCFRIPPRRPSSTAVGCARRRIRWVAEARGQDRPGAVYTTTRRRNALVLHGCPAGGDACPGDHGHVPDSGGGSTACSPTQRQPGRRSIVSGSARRPTTRASTAAPPPRR